MREGHYYASHMSRHGGFKDAQVGSKLYYRMLSFSNDVPVATKITKDIVALVWPEVDAAADYPFDILWLETIERDFNKLGYYVYRYRGPQLTTSDLEQIKLLQSINQVKL